MGKLPKGAKLGSIHRIKMKNGRMVSFKRVAMKGFPQWKIVSNRKK